MAQRVAKAKSPLGGLVPLLADSGDAYENATDDDSDKHARCKRSPEDAPRARVRIGHGCNAPFWNAGSSSS